MADRKLVLATKELTPPETIKFVDVLDENFFVYTSNPHKATIFTSVESANEFLQQYNIKSFHAIYDIETEQVL